MHSGALPAGDWGPGIAAGPWYCEPPRRLRPATLVLVGSLILLMVGEAAHAPLGSPTITIMAACALLGFGLPHGALDIDVLRRHAASGRVDLAGALLLYIACAALTFAVWKVVPLLGLTLFLGAAIKHFSDDWRVLDSPFLAYATGTALITATTLAHESEVREIFTNITGDPTAAIFADLLLLIAPVACLVGLVTLAVVWRRGEHDRAIGGGLSLLALLALPSVLGFALFFCLFHSPLHFHREAGSARLQRDRTITGRVVLLTVAAVGIGLAIYALCTRGTPEERSVSASFMTLAVLTMPHLIVPPILARRSPGRLLQQGRRDGF